MNWGSWQNFFHMGGYGLYVWGSYSVTLVIIVLEVISLRNRKKSLESKYGRTPSSLK